jgi:hypothetical protein
MKIEELRNEIDFENQAIKVILKEIDSLKDTLLSREPSLIEKAALSAFLMQFYNGIENILKGISRYNQIPLPSGEEWHI